MTSTKAPPPPLTADQMGKLPGLHKACRLNRETLRETLSKENKELLEKVNERVDYIWREMARMAGIDLKWWDYTYECFNCYLDAISVEEGSYVMPKNPTELQEALGWLFTDYEVKLRYLSMPNEEWKADFKSNAKMLLAGEKKRKALLLAKQKRQNNLRSQALAKIKTVLTTKEMKALGLK